MASSACPAYIRPSESLLRGLPHSDKQIVFQTHDSSVKHLINKHLLHFLRAPNTKTIDCNSTTIAGFTAVKVSCFRSDPQPARQNISVNNYFYYIYHNNANRGWSSASENSNELTNPIIGQIAYSEFVHNARRFRHMLVKQFAYNVLSRHRIQSKLWMPICIFP